jgi:hypothetical protein
MGQLFKGASYATMFGKRLGNNRSSRTPMTFIGGELVAGHWKQRRIDFTHVHPSGIGLQREPGVFSASIPMAAYQKMYDIEMDPHENLIVAGMFGGFRDLRSSRWLPSTLRQSCWCVADQSTHGMTPVSSPWSPDETKIETK